MGGSNTRGRLSSLAMSISASKYSFWILVSEKDPTLTAVTFFYLKLQYLLISAGYQCKHLRVPSTILENAGYVD